MRTMSDPELPVLPVFVLGRDESSNPFVSVRDRALLALLVLALESSSVDRVAADDDEASNFVVAALTLLLLSLSLRPPRLETSPSFFFTLELERDRPVSSVLSLLEAS